MEIEHRREMDFKKTRQGCSISEKRHVKGTFLFPISLKLTYCEIVKVVLRNLFLFLFPDTVLSRNLIKRLHLLIASFHFLCCNFRDGCKI